MKNYFDKFPSSYAQSSRRVITTPSSYARSAFFYVQETGYLKLRESHQARPKQLDSYLFVLVLSGKGTLLYDDHTYPLEMGSCFFIDCQIPYCHQSSPKEPWELLWVHFKGATTAAYYQYFSAHSAPVLKPASFSQLQEQLSLLLELCQGTDLSVEIRASRILTEILTLLLLGLNAPPEARGSGRLKMEEVRAYLDEHFTEKFSLDDLAQGFFVSKYHLSREFKACYGITLNAYVISRRISLAKRLLRFSDYTLEEIARCCGFYDASYLNKQFKKSEGLSASDFKRNWKSK